MKFMTPSKRTVRPGLIFSTLLILLASTATLGATERVGDFALLDAEGRFHQLSRYQHRDAVVLLAYDSACSAASAGAAELARLRDEYSETIEFLALDVTDATRSEQLQWSLPFPVLGDELKLVSESLSVSAAGEVLVFNPERMSLSTGVAWRRCSVKPCRQL
jgi:peroxiredoxin